MTPHQLRFVAIAAQAYAGISTKTKTKIVYPKASDVKKLAAKFQKLDPEAGAVIFFPEGYPYMQVESDQGKGKTSLLKAIAEAGGAEPPVNAVNTDENDKKAYFRFWGKDGRLYDAALTRSGAALYEVETDEDGEPVLNQKGVEIRKDVRTPKAMLQQVLGPTGISPLKVAEKNPDEQVKWIRSLYLLDQEVLKEEVALNKAIKDAFDARTKAGQKYTDFKKALGMNEYYTGMEEWQEYFAANKDKYNDVPKQMKEIQTKWLEYTKAESGLENLNKRQPEIAGEVKRVDDEIADLEKKLAAAKEKKVSLQTEAQGNNVRITTGEQWLKDNKTIKTRYENLTKLAEESMKYQLSHEAYNRMMADKKQMDHFQDEKIRLDGLVEAKRELKKKFIQTFSPDIKDFEVCVPDETDKREGLYFRKKPLNYLSESEQWEWFVPLCQQTNIQLILVDNINTLGTGSIQKFNEFASQGAYIFGTIMNRSEKALKITFDMKVADLS
jgi:outer membrane murein-binding lipoprotein Lpp